MSFHLEVLSPVKKIYDGDVTEVMLPSTTGDIAVLSKHMPFVTPLTFGEVNIKRESNAMDIYTIGKGLFFIKEDRATLLIEDVKSSEEISESDAEEARKKAQDLIAKGITPEEKLQGTYLLRRSLIDLRLIKKRQRKFT